MRAIIAVTTLIILSMFTTTADARARRHHHVAHHHQAAAPACVATFFDLRPCADPGQVRREPRRAARGARAVRMAVRAEPARKTHPWQDVGTEPRQIQRLATGFTKAGTVIGGRPPGCPRAYCGCGASIETFGRIVPGLNLAANWLRRFPRAAPAPEMAAARPGHVFILKQHIAGDVWMVHDSNSGGHRTRMHERSIAGYTIVNPHGGSA